MVIGHVWICGYDDIVFNSTIYPACLYTLMANAGYRILFVYFDGLRVEYAYTMQVTAPGNVYSYGVVLLELLTSRLPVDEQFGEGIDLVKWVHSASKRGESPEQIMDTRLSTVSFSWRKQMLADSIDVASKEAALHATQEEADNPHILFIKENDAIAMNVMGLDLLEGAIAPCKGRILATMMTRDFLWWTGSCTHLVH
ncbi:uncharacterized protein A4U43_C09F9210 [Asparagus officinalis]|uniref:Serine-threonine/tyrosine-protein kinase catalytic domain-containing protein n=1 Tax=Asparagus officinalis TaxID=4686 RepID=A0A5P1E9L0_ASPOF|nr:uncharacterized protein A4U43_C09F9210 [Asparagus officinalis]